MTLYQHDNFAFQQLVCFLGKAQPRPPLKLHFLRDPQIQSPDLDSSLTAPVAQEANDVRWAIEQFYRELSSFIVN